MRSSTRWRRSSKSVRPAQPITNADPRSAACSSRRSSRTTSCDYWARSSGTSLRPRMRKEDHSRVVVVWVMGGNFMGCDLGIGGGGVVSLGPAQCVRLLVVRPGIFIFFIFFSSLFLFSLAALVVIPIEEGCDLSLCGIFWGKQHFGFVFLFFFFFSSPFLIRLGWQVVCFVFFSIWKGFGLVLRFLLGGRGFSGKLGRSSQKK